MNEKSLEKNLANLERELVNLQTAHDVGLGVVAYYEYSGFLVPISSYGFVYILINIKSGDRLNPFLELYTDRNIAIPGVIKSNIYNDRYLARGYCIEQIQSAWKIVSTSQIEYRYSYHTSEAEEWIGEPIYE